jgi:hypothetical protein
VSFPDLGRMVLEITVTHRLGDRVPFFDVPGIVNTIVDRLGFVDMDEIDPLVFEEILDGNRKNA